MITNRQQTETLNYLAELGVEQWLARERLTAEPPARAPQTETVQTEPEVAMQQVKRATRWVILPAFMRDQKAWLLLDAILAAMGWHRAQLALIFSDNQNLQPASTDQVISFGLEETRAVTQAITLPALEQLLAEPRLKAQVMTHLLEAGLLSYDS